MLCFVKEFVRSPKSTGAVLASSRELAQNMTAAAELSTAKMIVEFGTGTGVFTEQILRQKSPESEFFGLEINPIFVRKTQQRCPSALIYQDSATNVRRYLTEHGHSGCDCIISGLPWSIFDRELQEELLQVIFDALNPGGVFVTFSYISGPLLPAGRRYNRLLPTTFTSVSRSKIIWQNLPPAFIYACRK